VSTQAASRRVSTSSSKGSVTGLGVGSLVKFNGIDVGKVTGLSFDEANPRHRHRAHGRQAAICRSRVPPRRTLGSTGLTGIAFIEFEGGNPNEPSIFDLAKQQGKIPTVKADPSSINDLLATAQDIFNRADRILSTLESAVDDIREPLNTTLENAATFSDALAKNSDKIDTFLESVGSVGQALADVSGKLDTTLKSIEGLLKAVDPGQSRLYRRQCRRLHGQSEQGVEPV
jgi:phospholipid/cholesterol/gamma-HCH transport system substrate-binding protein